MSKKKYRVQNPRNLPAKSPILTIEGKRYRKGQAVTVEESDVADLVARGFLKEVESDEK